MNQTESCHFLNAFSLKLPAYRIAVSTVYSITSCTAVILNLLVLITIWKTPSLHKASYILLANLALTDFLVGAVVQPLTVFTHVTALNNWISLFCLTSVAVNVFGYWLGSVSIFTLTVISIDRLLAIRLKNRYRTSVSKKRIIRILAFWWIKALFVTVMNIFIKEKPSELLLIVPAVILCSLLGIITVCYTFSSYSLRRLTSVEAKSEDKRAANPQPANQEMPVKNLKFDVYKYRRSLNTMLLLFLSIMFFYLPYLCSILTISVKLEGKLGMLVEDSGAVLYFKFLVLSQLMVVLISSSNPLLFLWRVRDLRKAALKKIKELFKIESHNEE